MNPILLHNVKYYMHNLNLDFNQTYTGLWYVNMLSVMLILRIHYFNNLFIFLRSFHFICFIINYLNGSCIYTIFNCCCFLVFFLYFKQYFIFAYILFYIKIISEIVQVFLHLAKTSCFCHHLALSVFNFCFPHLNFLLRNHFIECSINDLWIFLKTDSSFRLGI